MYLIVGLGNPGDKYKSTRHNVGFHIIDVIAEKFKIPEAGTKFNALVYKGLINTLPVLLIKPQTFMNASGKAVSQFINFYKISLQSLFIIYDDIEIGRAHV
jgi:PTH1 family peptidyl-tRNA hydrolase